MTDTKTRTRTPEILDVETEADGFKSMPRKAFLFMYKEDNQHKRLTLADLHGPPVFIGAVEDLQHSTGPEANTCVVGPEDAREYLANRLDFAKSLKDPFALLIAERDDGWVDVFIRFSTPYDLMAFTFQFGPDGVVKMPDETAQRVKEYATRALLEKGLDEDDADEGAEFLRKVIVDHQPHEMDHMQRECFLYGVVRLASEWLKDLDEPKYALEDILHEVFGSDV